MRQRSILKAVVLAAVCVGLSGCISLFPKAKPVQTYRFGVADAPLAAASPNAVSVVKGATSFPRAAAGDRILTVTGAETAYIAEARWTSAAALQFDDAVERAFDSRTGGPRLITRGDIVTGDINLRLDVDTFEARYLSGPDAAPTVVVSMRATLVRARDRAVMGEKVFAVQKRAADNRVSDIVRAFDEAVRESVNGLVDWTAGTVGA